MNRQRNDPRRPAADTRPVGLFVLGMHRSGTSVLTRILNLLGCALPENVLGANESNPTGHWESTRAIEINDELLALLGRRWDDPRELPHGWLDRPEVQASKVHIHTMLEREFSGKALWVLKDPRLCRLAPLWLQVAQERGTEIRVIVPIRHPGEVSYSLSRRDGLSVGTAHLLWVRHLLEAEAASRGLLRVLVNFGELMDDWESQCARIAAVLGVTWPRSDAAAIAQVESFIRPELRHSGPDDGVAGLLPLPPIVSKLYQDLLEGGAGVAGWQIIESAEVSMADSATLFAPAIDDAIHRAERNAQRATVAEALVEREVPVVNEAQMSELQARLAAVLGRVEEAEPLTLELVRQVEAQRGQIERGTERLSAESRSLFQKLEQTAPLAMELIRQVEAQRAEIGQLSRAIDTVVHNASAAPGEHVRLLEELSNAHRETRDALVTAVECRLQAAQAQLADRQSRVDVLDAQGIMLADQIAALNARASAFEVNAIASKEQVVSLQAQVQSLQELNQALVQQASVSEAERMALEDRHRELLAVHGAMEVQFEDDAESIRCLAEKLEAIGNTVELHEQRHRTIIQDLANREGELAAAEESERVLRLDLEAMGRRQLELVRELEAEKASVAELLNSTSWRVMGPFRQLWNMLRGTPATEGGLLRALYLSLPLPWSLRLSAKSLAFRIASPFIRHTEPFRRWQSQRQVQDVPLLPATTEAGCASGGEQSRSVAKPRVDAAYVPIATDSVALEELKAKLIAFYLPQFHPIPENNEWWGRGFTEWTNVTKAKPQFAGHGQPHLPGELGFYDLRVPQVMERQIELAKQYGVHGFCFHYYWFDGRRILEGPLDRFLGDAALDFPFCICWANENWTRRWDGHDNDVLLGQKHSPESDLRFIRDVEPILRDPRYIRVDGRPLLVVYRPSLLPDCAATVDRWREHCRQAGIGEILLVMVQFDLEDPRTLGFDVALEFPPHKLARNLPNINDTLEELNPEFSGYVVDYRAIVERSRKWPVPEFDMIRGVFPGWDNEARKPQEGYLFAHSSPGRYRDWLQFAVGYARQHPVHGEALVFVNAWNEWAEGAYLEPDRRHGYAYLQATREALTEARPGQSATPRLAAQARDEPATGRDRVVVVSHDAHPHGAQYLALNLCRELDRMGMGVDAVLLGEGVLEPDFAEVARVHKLHGGGGDAAAASLATRLASAGARVALANTTVSGLFAGALSDAGIPVVCMIHELPGVLRQYSLEEHAGRIIDCATAIVFAATPVADGFAQFSGMEAARAIIRPQGLYKRNRNRSPEAIAEARSALRSNFGLPDAARIILGMGYADHRKGIDLFVEAAPHVLAAEPDAHFVWAGHFDLSLEAGIRSRIKQLGLADRFHFPGRITDTDDYYAGADVFALSSREDPFPSVVMESLDVGVPVVAFAGTGGSEWLLRRAGGVLVDAIEPAPFAAACVRLLADDSERRALGSAGREIVETEFSFRRYVFDLLAAGGWELPRVSVVVPNYNYANLIEGRLVSIQAQTVPVFETIVLDDASTDDSNHVLEQLHRRFDFRTVRNETNSGSVFRQWLKGVALATGELVWIAEADDLSEPDFLRVALRGLDDPDVVMSYTESKQMGLHGEILAEHYRDYVADISRERWARPYIADGKQEISEVLAVKNSIPNVSAAVFRRNELLCMLRQKIDEIAGYKVAGDWAAYVFLLDQGKIAFDPSPLNLHRRHQGGVTSTLDNRIHYQEIRDMQERVAREYHPPGISVQQAKAYAVVLQKHFGIDETAVPK